jgi:putative ABC transport system permease protein
MGMIRTLAARFRALMRRDTIAGEIREELEFHVQMRTEEFERAGESSAEAARHARQRFGNLAVVQDRGYDVRGGGVMETVIQDARYGLRLLWTQRIFSLVAILTLALGIGMSTAVFSVIDAAMLRPLPYPHPEQLVNVSIEEPQTDGRKLRLAPSGDDVTAMRASGRVFADLAFWRNIFVPPIAEGPQPERLRGMEINDEYLGVYGASPIIGRGIERADTQPDAPDVMLLGYDYWQTHFGGKPDVLGRTVHFDDGAATIVGVLPATIGREIAIWRPLQMTPLLASLRGSGASIYGRLRPGMTLDQAQRDLTGLLAHQPNVRPGQSVKMYSLLDRTIASYQTTVNVLASAVGLVLLIACVNVAGLLLARGTTRLSEFAIRASIGAGRARLIRQLLTESLVLSVLGGMAGVALAWWSLDAIVANIPMTLPSNAAPTINVSVLTFSAGLSLLTSVVFGLAPALRLSRTGVSGALASGSRHAGSPLTRRGSQVLIGAEVAMAVVLLAGAGLMIRSLDRMLAVDLGFDPDRFVTLETETVDPAPATLAQYYPALAAAIRTLPGVAAVGAVNDLPLIGGRTFVVVTTDGGIHSGITVRQVLPGYFEAIGLPLRAGRTPLDIDRASGRHVVVVNEAAAKLLYPSDSPLGHRLDLAKQAAEVIGVVGDVRFEGPLRPGVPEVFRIFDPVNDPHPPRSMVVVVRPSGDLRGLPVLLRQAALGVGPRVLVDHIRTGRDLLAEDVVRPRQRTVLLSLLGGLGLLLSLVGVFGMTAYAVARRTQEIGVRMALGAQPGDVVLTMVHDAVVPIAAGIAVGLGGAMFATRVIATFLFNTTPTDPATLVAVVLTLAVAAGVAAWLPARRAARVDPVQALRAE